MGAAAHHVAVVQHDDPVGVLEAGRPLADDEHRHAARQSRNGLAQSRVGGKVQGAGAVVQNQDVGLCHQGPGDGQALALPARKVLSALLHRLVQAQGLGAHKAGGLGRLQSGPQLGVGGAAVPPQQVRADGAGEQLGLLHHDAHPAAQKLPGPGRGRPAEQLHAALGGVIKAGDQVHQAGFARAGAPDDADGLPLAGGEGDARQAGRARPGVGQAHMVEADGLAGAALVRLPGDGGGEGHARLCLQHGMDAPRAGQRLADLDDQVGQLDQLDQNLVHIVHQGDQVAGSHAAHVDLDGAGPQQGHDGQVDEHIGQGVGQGGQVAHFQLQAGQLAVGLLKALDLACLLAEGAHHPHAGQVLPRQAQHLVQPALHLAVERGRHRHDAEHHHRQRRDGDDEDQRRLEVDGKSADHGPDHHKGAAQKQPQEHIQPALDQVDVAGHPGDEGGSADGVHLGKAEGLDVRKQRVAQGGGVAHRGPGRKILCGDAAPQAHHGQKQQQPAPREDVAGVARGDAHVDDIGHDQRHQQVKAGLQHFEQRGDDALLFIAVQIGKHPVQSQKLLSDAECADISHYTALRPELPDKTRPFAKKRPRPAATG